MQFAIDENGIRINAEFADKKKVYRCPECGNRVHPKNGQFRIAYFAHEDGCECVDSWSYDLSEWHRKKQEYFDEEYREVIRRNGRTVHRADILKDGVVIEFQHSPISAEEFIDRNSFYLPLGYRVVWVFDVEDQIEKEKLYFEETDSDRIQMRWKGPKQVLKCCPNISDYNNKFALFMSWPHEDDEEDVIEKVIWSSKDEYGDQNFKRILISNYDYLLKKNMNLSKLFRSTKDRVKEHLKDKGRYEIKRIGQRGFPKESYICPRRPNQFGLKAFTEIGCSYCKYCGAMEKIGEGKYGSIFNVYCCYPNQINEENDPEYGLYESDAAMF